MMGFVAAVMAGVVSGLVVLVIQIWLTRIKGKLGNLLKLLLFVGIAVVVAVELFLCTHQPRVTLTTESVDIVYPLGKGLSLQGQSWEMDTEPVYLLVRREGGESLWTVANSRANPNAETHTWSSTVRLGNVQIGGVYEIVAVLSRDPLDTQITNSDLLDLPARSETLRILIREVR